jgi:putative ABC transport system permease protein
VTLATLAARNLTRNKTRVFLTVGGVMVTVIAFMIFRTLLASFTVQSEAAASDRIATRDKVSFINTLPKNYADKVRATPGVKEVTWANWFGGEDPRDKNNFFATVAVDAKSYLEVYNEVILSPTAREKFLEDRQAILIGDRLAPKLKVKEGDDLTLVSQIFPGEWKFHVAGIYTATSKSVDRSSAVFRWDYFNDKQTSKIQKDKIGWMISRIDDASKSADISKRIDATFDVLDQQTSTMSEKALQMSFLSMFSAILRVVDVVSYVIFGIMLLIVGNTIAMGVRERTHEYGTLLAIGFEPRQIGLLVVLESTFVGLVGGVLGAVVGSLMVTGLAGAFAESPMSAMLEFFRLDPVVAAVGCGVAVALGAVAALIPARSAAKLNVTNALRVVG